MYTGDRPLMLLYLVNVLQPVSEARLRREFGKLSNDAVPTSSEFREMVRQLLRNRFILKRKSLYAVTSSGLQKVSSFGLGRARDRNRLFLIKKLLYTRA
jgi:hypothetical protein